MHYNLAQLNIAKMLAPIDDPIMFEFVNNLERINDIAERSNGFIWRLKSEQDNATAIRVFEDESLIINMSVWKDLKSLFDFTYNTGHAAIMKRKKEWFSKMKPMHMVLWFVEDGKVPTPKDAKQRLAYLRKHGETPYAFSFKKRYTPQDLINYKIIEV
jgi:hypothetical protein